MRRYGDAPFVHAYWEFNDKTGEINGCQLHRLILANEVLDEKGLRTLTVQEGKELDRKKLLSNGVYRNFGMIVYSSDRPNAELAEKLVTEARKRGWELPVIAHPLALELDRNGIDILFGEDDSLVLIGEEAREIAQGFAYRANSGVRGLRRDVGGRWGADWDVLEVSGALGRVDWIRGEATRADLEIDALRMVEQTAQEQADVYLADLERRTQEALRLVRGKK